MFFVSLFTFILKDATGSTQSPVPTPKAVPMSVGIFQMTRTESLTCNEGDTYFDLNNIQHMNCNMNNLSSPDAYQCGLVCNTSDGILEYTFKGIQFAIYGTQSPQFGRFGVYINDTLVREINEYESTTTEYALLYTSNELEYGEHKIKTSPLEGKYEIYKFVYWPSKNARRINITEFNGEWNNETDGVGGIRENTNGNQARELSNIGCTKIWVYGTLGNWLGESTLSFGDFSYEINERQSERRDNELIYETPEFSYATSTIKFSSPSSNFVLNCVFVLDEPTDPVPTPKAVPMSVGIFQMTRTGSLTCNEGDTYFDLNNIQHMGCNMNNLSSPDAYQCGLVCNTSDGILEYTFKGIQFAIYGTNSLELGKFQVSINDTAEQEINVFGVIQKEYALLYTSNELEYGEHKIKTSPLEGKYEIYKFVYWPSKNARRINITEFNGEWNNETDGVGGIRENTNDNQARELSNIGCTKIWVYGTLGHWLGESTLSFGDFSYEINERQSERRDNELIYETPEFEYSVSTIKFSSLSSNFVLNCVFILDKPPGPVPTPLAVPMSVGIFQMTRKGSLTCNKGDTYFDLNNIQRMNCNMNDLSSPDAYQCGLVCNTSDGTLEYTFKGIQFAIYGTQSPQFGRFGVYINDTLVREINEYESTTTEYALLYTSNELEYGEHKIKTSQFEGKYEIYKFVYWPSKNARRINITEFNGEWNKETDGVGGIRENKNGNQARELSNIGCTKIWVYGTLGNWLGNSTLSFGDFSYEINEGQSERRDNELIYETPEFSYRNSTISFSNPTSSFVLNCLFVIDPMFVNDIILDDTNYTEYDDRRTRVEKIVPEADNININIRVIKSNFTKFHNDQGGAIHLENCGIACERTSFIECMSAKGGGGAIYIQNEQQTINNVNLDGLTFERCSAEYGGAAFVISNQMSNNVKFVS